MHSRNGFTLIEILLVIAAIGILSGLIVVAINPNRQLGLARDTERATELNSLEVAINQYILDEKILPDDLATIPQNSLQEVCSSSTDQSACQAAGLTFIGSLVPAYLPSIPQDPSVTGLNTGYIVQTTNRTVAGLALYSEQRSLSFGKLENLSPPQNGLVFWVSADQNVVMNGSQVTEWQDRSSFENNALAPNLAASGTLIENTLNGNPVIQFDGNDYYVAPRSDSLDVSTEIGIFIVISPSGTNVQPWLEYNNGGIGFHLWQWNNFDRIWVNPQSSLTSTGVDYDFSAGDWYQYTYVFNGSRLVQKVNTEVVYDQSASGLLSTNQRDLYIGHRPGSSSLNGRMAEIILYERGLSETETQIVEQYLAVKYGL